MKIDLNRLSKSNAMSIPFNGNIDMEYSEGRNIARVSNADKQRMPAGDEKNIALRKRVQSLWFEKTGGSYEKLEYLCQIKQNTFQKWMNGSRNMKRSELAKFVIGLSLYIEVADELFALQSHPLDCDGNRFDFITACAIRDRDDIEQFGKDVFAYCKQSIF